MKQWRYLTAMVVAMGLVGGCQTGDGMNDGLLIDPVVAQQQLDYTVDWQRDLGLPEGRELVYAELLGDRLVLLEDSNIVTVLDANNGRVLWRHQVTNPRTPLSRPKRDGERLVISSQRRAFVLDIQTGELERPIDLLHVSLGTPVVSNGLMTHASPRGVLFTQELDTGLQAWNYQVDVGFASSPTLTQNRLFATDLAGNVWCFDPESGELLWSEDVAEPVVTRPVAGDRLVYVPSTDRSLYAFLLTNGRQQWRHYETRPLDETPFLANDLLLQEVPEEAMLSLDPETGDVRWRSEELVGARPLQLRGQTLDLFQNGQLLHVDTREGTIEDRTELAGVEYVLPETRSGGDLYLFRLDGRILKASPR